MKHHESRWKPDDAAEAILAMARTVAPGGLRCRLVMEYEPEGPAFAPITEGALGRWTARVMAGDGVLACGDEQTREGALGRLRETLRDQLRTVATNALSAAGLRFRIDDEGSEGR